MRLAIPVLRLKLCCCCLLDETEKYHRFLNFTQGGCARLFTAISKEVRNPCFCVLVYEEGVQTGEEVVVKKPFTGYDRAEEFHQEIEAYKKIQGSCIVEYKDSYQHDSIDHLVSHWSQIIISVSK